MSQEVIRGIALPPAAQPGDPLARVDTPSLALDLTAFEANLRAMQAWADRHEVALRPHAKAHKCPQIALRQVALGARGICCQKVSEALPFVAAGIRDVHISNEVVGPAKMALLGQLARALPGLNFAGLQAYHGSVQHYRTREERATVSRQAARIAASYAQLLRESGIACDTITGGGTGSAEFDAASGVYTELQAGSYAFMDGDYGANEWGGPLNFQNSLFLLSTVMSTPTPDRVVLDAGLKSASAECGPPAVYGESGLTCTAINDEHSVVRVEPGATAPALGSVLRLVPAHVDPTFNLHDGLVVFKDGVVQDIWEISARGFSR
jgi:D-serine deaminase-like pyridoxal phosphate-dependent protein